ncbi:STAS domain-containing protein [Actinoplanes sp. NPDC049548]|uniref:STAS domain-containing protein n=1 Tax=Actinoplanes sp. NPDC049548 TaxID=3155152 RepID=UPI00341F2EB8
MPDTLSVTTHDPADGVRVLCISGDLDHDTAPMLLTAIEEALEDGSNQLVADLTNVAFCDSAGLSLFVDTHRRLTARGGWFRLAAPQTGIRYVLDVTNLDGYLTVTATVKTALELPA